ncbi:DeoR/GlpR family DNA-binding transcription regulator [Nocardioides perillae]|uniref:Lactose phosphotransferase system repressor n=1 Tax=Nocardioides perillae TaxID=1119534 RepID=A0A7Y9RVY4_9ACTN|nr:DeoR/GlpR family DNA-binding transcription regulator [Nocardioides perillae]NYG56341.1 DeoR family fructose operon transcriptional repressor [Nocardioides perillae]
MAQRIADRGRCAVAELAETYRVTTETVRRDLSTLEHLGLVRRVHGGAVPAGTLRVIESGVADRDRTNAAEKEAIARAALRYLPGPGSTVLLDAGTTTSRLAQLLPQQHGLSVVTHAVDVAAQLTGRGGVDLHLLPGRVRETTHAAVGAATVAALGTLRADLAVVGTNGISAGHGLSTPDTDEAAVKRAMVRSARQVVVLADSSKVGRETAVRFATLDEVDVLVTDAGVEAAARSALDEAGLEVVTA